MNILFLDQYSELGGAQRCLLDLLPAILERGWRIQVALPGDGPLSAECARLGAGVYSLPCGPYHMGRKTLADVARFTMDVARAARVIRDLIERHDIDLVYANGPRVLPAAARAAGDRVHLIFHCHSYLGPRYAWLAGRALASSNSSLIASSRFVAQPFRRYLPAGRLRVIYNGVPAAGRLRECLDGPWRIGIVGRIAPEKGQKEFLMAARNLAPRHPDCRYIVCGAQLFSAAGRSPYEDSLLALVRGLQVEFTGWLPDAAPVLSTLDFLVVPSAAIDATPRVILEAYSAGVPVVAFASGGIPEIVHDRLTGWLVPEHSVEALADTMSNVISGSRLLAMQAGAAALSLWKSEYTVERYRRQIVDSIESFVQVCIPARAASRGKAPIALP